MELDHHATFASVAELEAFFDDWAAGVPKVVRGWELEPASSELSVPGEHNRRNAASALAALELAGVARSEAEAALASFAGVDRRLQLVGERGGVRVYDDYGHNPTEIAAALQTARDWTERQLIAVYQPHVYERTRQLHRELGVALGLADEVVVTDVIGGRDAPRPGVSGKLVLDGRPAGSPPRLGADAGRRCPTRARVGAARRRRRDAGRRASRGRPRARSPRASPE